MGVPAGLSVVVIGGGMLAGSQLKTQYFPTDLQYLSYVDVFLPEDSPLAATAETTEQVEAIIRRVATTTPTTRRRRQAARRSAIADHVPRRWRAALLVFSRPEQSQLNYARF